MEEYKISIFKMIKHIKETKTIKKKKTLIKNYFQKFFKN